jgi:hypothetical protein
VPFALLCGSDIDLRRFTDRLGHHLRALPQTFQLAFASGFSTWHQYTPFDGLISIAQTAFVGAELARVMPTIPTVVWRNRRDIYRQVAWLAKKPPPAIGVHLSTFRTQDDWDWSLRGVRVLAEAIQRLGLLETTLVAYGPSKASRLLQLGAAWPWHIVVVSSTPYQLAMSHNLLHPDLSFERCDLLDSHELAVANAAAFEAGVTGALPGRAPSGLRGESRASLA